MTRQSSPSLQSPVVSKTAMTAYYTVKSRVPSGIMKQSRPPVDSKTVLELSLAILLAVRCRQKEAALQLLAKMYHMMEEDQAKSVMNRLIYLLEPTERDWMKSLA